MRRGIASALGKQIVEAGRIACPRKPIEIQPSVGQFRRRVQGATVAKLGRIGKRVVIRLDTTDVIVIEPRMTGLVLIADPPTREHLRWQLVLEGGPTILYWDRRGLGNVRLFSRRGFLQRFDSTVLGPDALQITAELYQQQLANSRREIKTALLDQRAVAGIGNLYASEILHTAGIHPQRRCDLMSRKQWQALASATRQVLEEAIRHEGSTLADGTYRNALNQSGSYQNQHRVYDRAGQCCSGCQSSTIRRIVQAQRSTFFCVQCQTRTGARC